MRIEVNGTRLWFDVEGAGLVVDGPTMRERPSVLVVHGGPATYDHSYLKPYFGRLTDIAQVVYVDLRDHGRSAWGDPTAWTFESCADDLAQFCDALGIVRPIVLGHSMGGFVVMMYGARHPGHAAALVLQSTMARFDLDRLVEGFRRAAGDEVAELARRSYRGDEVTHEEWVRIFAAFGPNVPSDEELGRRTRNLALAPRGGELLRRFDVRAQLASITSPTLVSVGELDAVTPVSAAHEIAEALPPAVARLQVIPGAGHFAWLDAPDEYFAKLRAFIRSVTE